jgi:hypothetical protein
LFEVAHFDQSFAPLVQCSDLSVLFIDQLVHM